MAYSTCRCCKPGVKLHTGPGQWLVDGAATFAPVLTILGAIRHRPQWVAVACVILAGYWFTWSTSFANPASTLVRAMTDSFSGIRPADVPGFVMAEIACALNGAATGALSAGDRSV